MKRIILIISVLIGFYLNAQQVTFSGDPDASYFRARDLAFAGQHRIARDTLESILTRYPDYTDVRSLLARTYSWDADYGEARRHLNRITSVERQNKEAWIAAIDNEIFAKNKHIALGLCLKALIYLPGDAALSAKRSQLEAELQRAGAEEIGAKKELNPEANFNNQFALYNAFDVFDVVYEPMIYGGLEYTRSTDAGKIIPRINYANRFDTHGLQYEMDFYPRMSKLFYGYLSYGFSDSEIFPNHRVGVELFANIPGSMEASMGIRYLDFLDEKTTIFTASYGLYKGNYYFSLRPYLTPAPGGSLGVSGALTARKYLRHKEHYMGMIFNMGFIPELRQLTSNNVLLAESLFFIESRQLLLEYQFSGKSLSNLYKAQLGITHQELVFEPGRFIWALTAGIKYHVRF